MLGFYNYTVVLTYLGMLIAFLGITSVMRGNIHMTLVCLMIAGVCDMFDGKIASTKVRTLREKRFGIQIDSLSDLVAFGMLPACLIYHMSQENTISLCICGMYLLCALIRLAYFNVDEEERQNQTTESRKVYLGLPVTSVALIIPLLICIGNRFYWPLEILGPVVLLLIAVAFITPFQIRKPEALGKIGILICGSLEFLMLFMR